MREEQGCRAGGVDAEVGRFMGCGSGFSEVGCDDGGAAIAREVERFGIDDNGQAAARGFGDEPSAEGLVDDAFGVIGDDADGCGIETRQRAGTDFDRDCGAEGGKIFVVETYDLLTGGDAGFGRGGA